MDSMTVFDIVIYVIGYIAVGFLVFTGFLIYWKGYGITYKNLVDPETYKGDVDYIGLSIAEITSILWIVIVPPFLVYFAIEWAFMSIMKRTLGEK